MNDVRLFADQIDKIPIKNRNAANCPKPLRGIIYYACVNICMVVDVMVIHYLGDRVSVDQIVNARAIGTAILVAVLARHRGFAVFHTPRYKSHLVRGVLTVLSFWAIFYSLAHLVVADAVSLNYTRAMFLTIFGFFWLGEATSRWHWAATGVNFAAMLLIVGPSFNHWDNVYLIAIGGAALNAAMAAASKYMGDADGILTVMAYSSLAAIVVSLLITGGAISWNEPLLLVIGISAALNLWLGQLAMRDANLSLLAPYGYLRLPLTILLGVWLFGEVPSVTTACGAALILASGLVLWFREARHPV